MRYISFALFILVIGLSSCEGEGRKIEEIVSKPLSFEEHVLSHTKHYCKCAKPLDDFSSKINVQEMDSAITAQYKNKQMEFLQCFDPQGRLKQFRDTLSQEMKDKQMELFDKYRQEICPTIIPNR